MRNSGLVSSQVVSASGWRNPTISIQRLTYQFISGTLTGYADPPEDGGYSLLLSIGGVVDGMSGGPLLDDDYRVVGIVGQIEGTMTGPSGLSLAIPISAFLNSEYGQYVQESQRSVQNGLIDLEPQPLDRISVPAEGYQPAVEELPRF